MLKRVNPISAKQVNPTLKEAVAESILNTLYESVSGGGVDGKVIVGSRPSIKYVSGFLEPVVIARESGLTVDETANPIHIITIGLDLVVTKGVNATLNVTPSFSIYVRMLPTTDDLIRNKTRLDLTQDVKANINTQVYARIQQYDGDNEDLKAHDSTAFFRDRNTLRTTFTNDILQNLGMQIHTAERADEVALVTEKEALESKLKKEGEAPTELENNTDTDAEYVGFDFLAFPGMTTIIPSDIVIGVTPLQRWFRIDLEEAPGLKINVDTSAQVLNDELLHASDMLNQFIQQHIGAWLSNTDPNIGGKLWAFPAHLTVNAEDIRHWDATLDRLRKQHHDQNDPGLFALPHINLQWVVDISDNHDDASVRNVRIAIENQTDSPDWRSVELEESIFQAELTISLKSEYHHPLKLDRIKPSYRYNQYLYYPGLGFNNGIVELRRDDERQLKTTWMPIYRQPRIRPISRPGVDIRFSVLQTIKGTKALKAIPDEFDDWIEEIGKSINPAKGASTPAEKISEKNKFTQDKNKWREESHKIRAGIQLLYQSATAFQNNKSCREAIPFKAWAAMNEAMGLAAKGKHFDSWRLFQVAFILANIPGLTSRMDEFKDAYDEDWDEAVALLYFATGGGKTESFFGLLVFNLFLDRLRGKHHGITAMIRYPLRLLTIQQAQRLAKTLAAAEKIRFKRNIPGDPFAIGFWVGGGNTPNHRRNVSSSQVPVFHSPSKPQEEHLKNSSNQDYTNALEDWNKLPDCPFCKNQTVLRAYRHRNGLIGHACPSAKSKCEWNAQHGGAMKEPLPFYIVDEDIYEMAPSVILGTIDKLALIGQSPGTIRRFLGMFGLAPMLQENGHLIPREEPNAIKKHAETKLFPCYEQGNAYFYDPFPSMIIQDEAHLLEESLGTFSGIFQTTLEHMLQQLGSHPRMRSIVSKVPNTNEPRMPKIIAASATVSQPERQMEDLYQRNVTQFPYPGPHLYESFYAKPELRSERRNGDDIEVQAHTARFYASICSNGRPHTTVSVEILGHFHLLITQLLKGLCDGNPTSQQDVRQRIKNGIQRSILKSLYLPAIESASNEALATLIDLHRISLTYVTNKKGGDQIMAAESDTTARIHEDAGIEFEGLQGELISGAVSAAEIQRVIDIASMRPAPGSPLQDIVSDSVLRSVVATSAISHGVDVDEFNTMFFAGMPSNPAEYIQSSSRIGRTHVGLSILIPTPQRRRDRYILETHDQYHRFLERMIRPAAVNRWAENAIVRTLPSLFQAYVVGVCESIALLNADDRHKHTILNHEKLNDILRIMNQKTEITFRDNICEFANDAIGLNHPTMSPSAPEHFSTIIFDEIVNILNFLAEHKDLPGLKSLFKEIDRRETRKQMQPMTSLRDVDPAGWIEYVPRRKGSATSENVYDIMKFIRKGGS